MSVLDSIESLIAPMLARRSFELIETQYRREQGGWVLRLFIDRSDGSKGKGGGITLDDCQSVSRWVEELLDQSNVPSDPYNLEVSSPGINRPLKTAEHFKKFAGQKAKVTLSAPLSPERNQKNFTGVIIGVRDQTVEFNDVVSGNVEIPIAAVAKARLDLI